MPDNVRVHHFLLLLILAASGCQYIGGDVWYQKKEATPSGEIKIVLVPEDVPRLRRTYTVQIKSRDLRMEITARSYLGVMYSGELTQSFGKWVLFDPESPADKILDREILPEVEARCKEILALDKQWRSSKPKQFIDESGQVWERQP